MLLTLRPRSGMPLGWPQSPNTSDRRARAVRVAAFTRSHSIGTFETRGTELHGPLSRH